MSYHHLLSGEYFLKVRFIKSRKLLASTSMKL